MEDLKNAMDKALEVAVKDLELTASRLDRAIQFGDTELGYLGRLRGDMNKSIMNVAALRGLEATELSFKLFEGAKEFKETEQV